MHLDMHASSRGSEHAKGGRQEAAIGAWRLVAGSACSQPRRL